jgi:hypothetical protein
VPRSSPFALGLCLALSLGCANQWRDINAESFSDATVEVEDRVAAGAPRRDELLGLIDDGFVAAWERRVGLIEALGFTLTARTTVQDGQISPDELQQLRDRATVFFAVPVTPERRAEVLAFKAAVDARRRVELRALAR